MATTVLTLMVLMLTALLNSAALTVTAGNRHLAADDQARQVFDRMQVDFARMLKRNDVYFSFGKPPGNDTISFYGESPGYFTAGPVTAAQESDSSLISYQIPTSAQLTASTQNMANVLCRLGMGDQWTDIAFTPGTTPTALSITNGHILSNAIFRVETGFIYRAGDTKLLISPVAPAPGSNFQNLEAVIVALGILDADSQKIIPAAAYTSGSLVNALPDYMPTAAPTSIDLTTTSAPNASAVDPILYMWRSAINSSTFAQTAGIPATAAKQIRVYQRIFYLQ